jgi:anti-sigma regulatory factor (Ser/Thr protein kinase)
MSQGFRHEALFYLDLQEFLDGTLQFVEAGLDRGEPVMVAVDERKAERLRDALGTRADAVEFVDMAPLGRNPARIIPLWRRFVTQNASGGPARGVGEPVWPGRSNQELEECDHHESLLNFAFGDADDFRLLCPYDTQTLSADVLAGARRNHPWIADDADGEPSRSYEAPGAGALPFAGRLPPPSGEVEQLEFDRQKLAAVRRFVEMAAASAGIDGTRRSDIVLAASELAANSVVHGGGSGRARVWQEPDAFLFEVADQGVIDDALAGRRLPSPDQLNGRGLWIVNQLCDLVQVRSDAHGSVVRFRIDLKEQSPALN